jgi:hypothetical protein
MDPYLSQIQLGQTPEEQQLLAQALRENAGVGSRLSTSSLEPVQKQGRLMQTTAQQQAQNAGLQQTRARTLTEKAQDRLTKAIQDERGIAKLSNNALEKIEKDGEQLSSNRALFSSFSPSYASKVGVAPVGKAFQGLASHSPGLISGLEYIGAIKEGEGDRLRQAGDWWSRWKYYRDNIIRHELFGSALTEPERKLWEASTINENMDEETLVSRLKMMELAEKKMQLYRIKQRRASRVGDDIIRVNYSQGLTDEEFNNPDKAYEAIGQRMVDMASENSAAFASDEELRRIAAGGGQ